MEGGETGAERTTPAACFTVQQVCSSVRESHGSSSRNCECSSAAKLAVSVTRFRMSPVDIAWIAPVPCTAQHGWRTYYMTHGHRYRATA